MFQCKSLKEASKVYDLLEYISMDDRRRFSSTNFAIAVKVLKTIGNNRFFRHFYDAFMNLKPNDTSCSFALRNSSTTAISLVNS